MRTVSSRNRTLAVCHIGVVTLGGLKTADAFAAAPAAQDGEFLGLGLGFYGQDAVPPAVVNAADAEEANAFGNEPVHCLATVRR